MGSLSPLLGVNDVSPVAEAAPYFSLARAAWVPCVVTWSETGELRRLEGPEGFTDDRQALDASRFLMRGTG